MFGGLRQHAIGLAIFVNNEPGLMIFSHNVYIATLYTMKPKKFMWGWGGGGGGGSGGSKVMNSVQPTAGIQQKNDQSNYAQI